MQKLLIALFVVAYVRAEENWWDPLGLTAGNQNQPILAKLTPAVQSELFWGFWVFLL
jgi:hypothetical protein